MMAGIRARDTKPELLVRKLLFAEGYRYRLHRKELPGCPDIVMPKYKLCIFVHGCYWHQHKSCKLAYTPKSNSQIWSLKFASNANRDQKTQSILLSKGWRILIVWECASRFLAEEQLLKLLLDSIRTDVPFQELMCNSP